MSFQRTATAFLLTLALAPTAARGDYLLVRRDAVLRTSPSSDSDAILTAKPDDTLALIADGQTNGYYRIRLAGGSDGWIYRTFVRRYPGDLPSIVRDRSGPPSEARTPARGTAMGAAEPAVAAPATTRLPGGPTLSLRAAPALTSAGTPELRADQVAKFAEHCGGRWGVPVKQIFQGPTYYVSHPGYVLEYSAARKLPLWVCHHVTAEQLTVSFSGAYRRPAWREEEGVPVAVRVHDNDYPSGGKPYNRGHMAPNADFGSKEGRDGTFILSNAVPQQWENNQRIWETFEGYVRDWIERRGEAYVITGSLLYDPSDDPESDDYDREGHDGVVDYQVMGASEVTVPTHVFKIVIAPKALGSSDWESIGVVLENRRYLKGSDKTFDDDLDEGIRSIDWIEKRSGLDLLPALGEGTGPERAMESESAKPAHLWAR